MLLLAIQLTLTSPDVQCLNLRDRMQALERFGVARNRLI